jgi:hypothetical protein
MDGGLKMELKFYDWLKSYQKLTTGSYEILLPKFNEIWCELSQLDMEHYWDLFSIKREDYNTKGDMVNCENAVLRFDFYDDMIKIFDGLMNWPGTLYIFEDGELIDYRYI